MTTQKSITETVTGNVLNINFPWSIEKSRTYARDGDGKFAPTGTGAGSNASGDKSVVSPNKRFSSLPKSTLSRMNASQLKTRLGGIEARIKKTQDKAEITELKSERITVATLLKKAPKTDKQLDMFKDTGTFEVGADLPLFSGTAPIAPDPGKYNPPKATRQLKLLSLVESALAEKAAGRAKKGGETGVNGEFYKGGEFLPSTNAPKGTFTGPGGKGKKSGNKLRKKELAPYEWKEQPSPYHEPLYAKTGAGSFSKWADRDKKQLKLVDDNEVNWTMYMKRGDDPVKHTENLKKHYKKYIDAFNSGKRWIVTDDDNNELDFE